MDHGQQETIGRKARRNYDILIAVSGLPLLLLIQPLESYIAYTYSSVYSGSAAIPIVFTSFSMVMSGLIARICRHLFGSGIN
jgi:hypothetical protein